MNLENFYTIKEASKAYGISRASLYEHLKNGRVKFKKVLGHTLIPKSEIVKLKRLRGKKKRVRFKQ